VHWTAPGKQVMLWPSRIPPPGNLPAHLVGCGRPGKKPTTPPRLNHFTCYPVKQIAGEYKPPAVMLQDEFATKGPVPAKVNPVPAELCLPTEKVLASGQSFPIINPTLHLLCFPVSPTPIISPVWDENQFGTSKVTIKKTNWLCLPSTKQIAAG
jgi:hypothetical protein